jgi:hypothetical protein
MLLFCPPPIPPILDIKTETEIQGMKAVERRLKSPSLHHTGENK